MPTFLLAFLYIPFHNDVITFLKSILPLCITSDQVDKDRLIGQVMTLAVTAQIQSLVVELIMPFLVEFWQGIGKQTFASFLTRWKSKVLMHHDDAMESDDKEEEEESGEHLTPRQARYLNRLLQQRDMPIYMVEKEYVDKIQQLGHILLFGPVWPLISTFSLIKSIIAIRTDAITLTLHHQRPLPIRVDSIGPWINILRILGWLSVALMPVWRFLLMPTPATVSLDEKVERDLEEKDALIELCLSIFIIEKAYLAVLLFIRMLLRRIPSSIDLQARKAAFQLKSRFMKTD